MSAPIHHYLEAAKEIDFARGFSHWHVKWPLKNALEKDENKSISAYFETTFPISQNCVTTSFSVLWAMKIDNANSDDSRWIGLSRQSKSMPLPILYRVALREDGNTDIIFNFAKVHFFDHNFSTSWRCLSTDELALFKSSNKLSLHIFMAIPIGVKESTAIDIELGGFNLQSMEDEENKTAYQEFVDEFGDLLKIALGDEKKREGEDETGENGGESKEEIGVMEDESKEEEDSDDEFTSDFKVIIHQENKPDRQFNCHRAILLARCPFFRRLFRRRRASSRSNLSLDRTMTLEKIDEEMEDAVVVLDDVDEISMAAVLRFIYIDTLPTFIDDQTDKLENALNMVKAAVKFGLSKLLDYSVAVLIFRYDDDDTRFQQLALTENTPNLVALKLVCEQQLATFVLCKKDAVPGKLSEQTETDIWKVAMDYLFNCIAPNVDINTEQNI